MNFVAGAAHIAPAVTVWGPHMFALGPLMALCGIGVLVLVLRWGFSGRHTSLIARTATKGGALDYGLLTPVGAPTSHIEAAIWREALDSAGIRCTITDTADGARVMVFAADSTRAISVLQQQRRAE